MDCYFTYRATAHKEKLSKSGEKVNDYYSTLRFDLALIIIISVDLNLCRLIVCQLTPITGSGEDLETFYAKIEIIIQKSLLVLSMPKRNLLPEGQSAQVKYQFSTLHSTPGKQGLGLHNPDQVRIINKVGRNKVTYDLVLEVTGFININD